MANQNVQEPPKGSVVNMLKRILGPAALAFLLVVSFAVLVVAGEQGDLVGLIVQKSRGAQTAPAAVPAPSTEHAASPGVSDSVARLDSPAAGPDTVASTAAADDASALPQVTSNGSDARIIDGATSGGDEGGLGEDEDEDDRDHDDDDHDDDD